MNLNRSLIGCIDQIANGIVCRNVNLTEVTAFDDNLTGATGFNGHGCILSVRTLGIHGVHIGVDRNLRCLFSLHCTISAVGLNILGDFMRAMRKALGIKQLRCSMVVCIVIRIVFILCLRRIHANTERKL